MANKSFTRFIPTVARILLGLPLFANGVFGLLNQIPQPTTPLAEGAAAFADALMKSGYMLQLIFITQLIVGILLLTNRFVPLALVIFAPFLVNAVAFHFFLEYTGRPFVAIFLLLELYLAWQYRQSYAVLLTPRAAPSARG